MGGSAQLVPAPPVVGLDQREAVTVLAQEGLRVGRLSAAYHSQPFGTVLRQSPGQGIVVAANGTVDLLVSKGVEMTVVPREVVGLSRDEAEVRLRDRKLGVAEVVTRDGLYSPGTVLAVTPPVGQQVRAGSEVTLTVASGRVEVPDVRDRSQDDAVKRLRAAGFSVRVEQRYADATAGRVLAQSPVGRLRQAGSTVELVVAEPVPAPPPAVFEPSPAADPGVSPPG